MTTTVHRAEAEIARSRLTANLALTAIAHSDSAAAQHAARALRLGADPAAVAAALADHCALHEAVTR